MFLPKNLKGRHLSRPISRASGLWEKVACFCLERRLLDLSYRAFPRNEYPCHHEKLTIIGTDLCRRLLCIHACDETRLCRPEWAPYNAPVVPYHHHLPSSHHRYPPLWCGSTSANSVSTPIHLCLTLVFVWLLVWCVSICFVVVFVHPPSFHSLRTSNVRPINNWFWPITIVISSTFTTPPHLHLLSTYSIIIRIHPPHWTMNHHEPMVRE